MAAADEASIDNTVDDEAKQLINNEIIDIFSLSDEDENKEKIIDDLLSNGRQSLAKYQEDIVSKTYEEVMNGDENRLMIALKKYFETKWRTHYGTSNQWFVPFLEQYHSEENETYERILTRTAQYGDAFLRSSPVLSIVLQLLFEGIDDQCLKETDVLEDLCFTITNNGLKSVTKFSDYIVKSRMNEQLKSQSILSQALRLHYREQIFSTLKECKIANKDNLFELALDDVTENGWLADMKSIEDNMTPKAYKMLLEKLRSFHQKEKPQSKEKAQAAKVDSEAESASSEEDSKEEQERDEDHPGFTAAQNACQKEALKLHNVYRARHGVPLLALDDTISRSAQTYADYLASTGRFQHSTNRNGLGENLYSQWGSASTGNTGFGTKATQSWYDEIKDYSFSRPGFSMSTGHFTQVVWKSTNKLGMGIGFADGGRKVIVVAQYGPAGNMMGAFPQNVPRPN